jgi:hypothetical protein
MLLACALCSVDAVNGVVVGNRDDVDMVEHRTPYELGWCLRAVRSRRVAVQVDHRHPATLGL